MISTSSKSCKVAPSCHFCFDLHVRATFYTRRPFLAPRWSAAFPSHRSCAVPLSLFEYFTFLLSLMRDAALSSHCVHACGSAGMRVLGAWCDGACVWPLTPVCPPVPACLSQNDAVWTHLTEAGITHMAIRVISLSRLLPRLVCLLLRSLLCSLCFTVCFFQFSLMLGVVKESIHLFLAFPSAPCELNHVILGFIQSDLLELLMLGLVHYFKYIFMYTCGKWEHFRV